MGHEPDPTAPRVHPLGQTSGDAARATDGRIAPEGAAWDVPPAVVLDGAEATLTWDLGGKREVRGLLLQGDANDRFPLSGSLDGRDFAPLGRAKQVLKDLDMLHDLTKALEVPTPMADQARALYRLLCARGHKELDGGAVFKLYDSPPV